MISMSPYSTKSYRYKDFTRGVSLFPFLTDQIKSIIEDDNTTLSFQITDDNKDKTHENKCDAEFLDAIRKLLLFYSECPASTLKF